MKQIDPCPKCEARNGWFEKRTQWYDQLFDENGKPSFATETRTIGGKRKYCLDCGKDITKCVRG